MRDPASIFWPGCTSWSLNRPLHGDFIIVCIIRPRQSSNTARICPSSTVWPSRTSSDTILHRIGATKCQAMTIFLFFFPFRASSVLLYNFDAEFVFFQVLLLSQGGSLQAIMFTMENPKTAWAFYTAEVFAAMAENAEFVFFHVLIDQMF